VTPTRDTLRIAPLRIALVGLFALAVAMGVGRFAYTPLLPLMRADGLLDLAGGGWLASIHFLGYLIGAGVAAWTGLAPRLALRGALLVIGLSTLGMGLTENFALWSLFRWLAGAGSAFTLVLVSNFMVKHLAEQGHPGAQGWIFAGVGGGIVLAGLGVLALMAGGVGSALSWRVFGTVTLAVCAVLMLALGPEMPARGTGPRRDRGERTPLSWPLLLAYGAVGLGYVIPATYLPVMAREIVADPLVFGWGWPMFGLAAFVSTPLAARLRARFSARRIWAASQLVMAAGLLLPALLPHIGSILLAAVCVGGTFMIITMAGMQEAHRFAPAADVMRHIAAMTTAFAAGQMIGPVFASMLYEAGGGFALPLIVTSLLLLGAVLALRGGATEREITA